MCRIITLHQRVYTFQHLMRHQFHMYNLHMR
ncbi:unnamed protein product [Cuscuta epithymum]|nr:unnamed protein product [Cuscuta epithymum]